MRSTLIGMGAVIGVALGIGVFGSTTPAQAWGCHDQPIAYGVYPPHYGAGLYSMHFVHQGIIPYWDSGGAAAWSGGAYWPPGFPVPPGISAQPALSAYYGYAGYYGYYPYGRDVPGYAGYSPYASDVAGYYNH